MSTRQPVICEHMPMFHAPMTTHERELLVALLFFEYIYILYWRVPTGFYIIHFLPGMPSVLSTQRRVDLPYFPSEIRSLISQSLGPASYDTHSASQSRRDLLHLALSGTYFCSPALDELWGFHQQSLIPLLKTFNPNLWSTRDGEPVSDVVLLLRGGY